MQPTNAPIRIDVPRFPGNRRIAFTSSWDDGPADDRKLVSLLNKNNLPATFNLIADRLRNNKPAEFVQTNEVIDVYAGHEIANHTVTHPSLVEITPLQVADEIIECRKRLEDIVCLPVRGLAYPYGAFSEPVKNVLRDIGTLYARTVELREPNFPLTDALAWNPTSFIAGTWPAPPLQRWENFYNNRGATGVFCLWGHSYDITRKNEWPAAEKLFASIGGKSDVWYCTNLEAFEYESARSRLVVAANKRSVYNPSALPITIKVDGTLIEAPPGRVMQLSTQPIAAAA